MADEFIRGICGLPTAAGHHLGTTVGNRHCTMKIYLCLKQLTFDKKQLCQFLTRSGLHMHGGL